MLFGAESLARETTFLVEANLVLPSNYTTAEGHLESYASFVSWLPSFSSDTPTDHICVIEIL